MSDQDQAAARTTPGWARSRAPVGYADALAFMEARAGAIAAGQANELVWLLEHPPVYTAGTSARTEDLIDPNRFEVHAGGRGGQYTYHGPGQLVAYLMLDLGRRGRDVRAFVRSLEDWLIDAIASFGVHAHRREGCVGVWVTLDARSGAPREAKLAALGIRVRRWVTFHGIALNVAPDLSHYDGIVPCGVRDADVTSLEALGVPVRIDDAEAALRASFERHFGQVRDARAPFP
jgi:lipoyl(octanoyl) transferase